MTTHAPPPTCHWNDKALTAAELVSQLHDLSRTCVDVYEQLTGQAWSHIQGETVHDSAAFALMELCGPSPLILGQHRTLELTVITESGTLTDDQQVGPVATAYRTVSGEIAVSAKTPLFPSPLFGQVARAAALLAAHETLIRAYGASVVDITITVDGHSRDLIEYLELSPSDWVGRRGHPLSVAG